MHPLIFLIISASAVAQRPDSLAVAGSGATITGVVYDSVSRTNLSGAIVQVIDFDGSKRFTRTTVSDSLGRFSLHGIPEGRYKIGFFHAMLDSLGIDAPLRELSLSGRARRRCGRIWQFRRRRAFVRWYAAQRISRALWFRHEFHFLDVSHGPRWSLP